MTIEEGFIKLVVGKIWEASLAKLSLNQKVPDSPVGIVLGGQPGAGKSVLTKKLLKHFSNILFINADEYRCWHPDYQKFQKELGKDSVKATSEFSGRIASELLKRAVERKLNVAIEGTFRTSEVPLSTLNLYKSNGYTTYVLIKTCPAEMSWNNCKTRYTEALKAKTGEERYTDKKVHDYVVSVLGKNADAVYKSGLVDRFYVFDKDNSLIFSSKDQSNKLPPSHAIEMALKAGRSSPSLTL